MELLIFIAVVVVVLALVVYAISLLPMIPAPFKNILMVLAVLAGIIVICNKAGIF
jgi:hypothetical protein